MSRLNALAALTLATALSLGALAPPAAANDRLDLYKKRRALVIGIDEYKDPAWGALNYARSDAEAVGKKLTALGFSVDYLFDKDATRDGILARFNVLEQEVEEDDQVFVFFSGHGITTGSPKDKVGYLIPTDGVRSHLLKTALSLSVLRDLSRALKARHVMFALDACFAGNILENTRGPGGVRPGNRQIYNDMLQAKVRLVLAAANENQKAHEVDGRGLFTRALLDALNGAVKPNNADGILFGQDIATYIRSAVSDMAQRNHKKQNPIHGHLQGAASHGDYMIALAPSPGAATPPRPTYQPSAPREVASLSIRSPGENVYVWLNDKRLGTAGPAGDIKLDLAPGTHRLRAQAHRDASRTWAHSVEMAANVDKTVVVEIEPERVHPRTLRDDYGEMVLVQAGAFWMGSAPIQIDRAVETCKRGGRSDAECRALLADEVPRHRVTLDAFYIDRLEVTNAQFERFVNATGHQTAAEREGWGQDGKAEWAKVYGASWRAPRGAGSAARADHPVVQVTWHDAEAYCRWAGGRRLPSEAQWEKAARGADGRLYPWGEQWDGVRANANLSVAATSSAGAYPSGASPFGALDMAGNVAEWVADWYAEDYYRASPTKNPSGPSSGQARVARGGSLASGPLGVRTTVRLRYAPDDRSPNLGFRCAKDAAP